MPIEIACHHSVVCTTPTPAFTLHGEASRLDLFIKMKNRDSAYWTWFKRMSTQFDMFCCCSIEDKYRTTKSTICQELGRFPKKGLLCMI